MMSRIKNIALAVSLVLAVLTTASVADDEKMTPFTNPLTNQWFQLPCGEPG